ncbi:MAG: PD40 domain-containing protein [Calditrichaeota bacterium]|nr:PD40 domain-containing protein [Calditrichota bacterium]
MKQFSLIIFLILSLSIFLPEKSESQWYYYGRNKVQYTDFEWHVLKTDHFDIYYYPEMAELAEKGAAFAEESYRYLENKFNFTINRRIPLIFYSSHLHFQQTNITPYFVPEGVGGFFEFLKGRVVIPSDGNINQFRKVIFHELVHVFMHSKIYFENKEHSRFEGTYPPLWYVEGLAEYWSSEWDAQAEMVIRDAVLNNYIVPLSNMYQINGTFMMYKEGQAILTYIANTYGEEKILQLMEEIWKYGKFSDVFQEVVGKTYEQFDQEWLYYLKKKYYPLMEDNDFSKMITYSVVTRGYNFKPAYYKDVNDEEYVVFFGNRGGYSNIYIKDLRPFRLEQKEKAEILVKGERTPDFESLHLFSSKIDVDKAGNLTFSSKSGENDALYIYSIPERRVLKKHQWSQIVAISSPSFSPDGHKVVFAGVDFSGKQDLYILDRNENYLIRLTDDFYEDKAPSFSPDGRKIVFSSDRTMHGKDWCYNLFIYDLDTDLIHYVTYGRFQDETPVWSPDGQYIAFTSNRDTSLNLWIADLSDIQDWEIGFYDRVKLKQISRFINAAFDPEWTDDNRLLFTVYENNRFEIRMMDKIKEKSDSTQSIVKNEKMFGHRQWKYNRVPGSKIQSKLRYQKKYDLDIAQAQVSQDPFWGTTGGAVFAFTDILGNDQYYFMLYNNAQSRGDFFKSFNGAVTKVSLENRLNHAYGLFRFSGRYFNYKDGYFYEDRVGGFFTLSYPFSQYNRMEFNTNLSYSDKDVIGLDRRHAIITSNSISFVSDNSIWWYTGPMEGHRYNISVGNTYDLRWSNVNYYTFRADLRQYTRLAPRLSHAIRVLLLYNEGKDSRWYYLGGSWDLRGYRQWSIRGEKIFFLSNELRFPFIDYIGIKFPFLGLGFRAIHGALFLDAGNAWNDEWNGLLGSTGFGFRMNFGGFLVLRLDIGKKTDFREFTSDWFTQFFFGWDF